MISVDEWTLKLVAGLPPNDTPVAPANPAPLMSMVAPPLAPASEGETDEITGGVPTSASPVSPKPWLMELAVSPEGSASACGVRDAAVLPSPS